MPTANQVYLDTSIFVRENYLHGSRIKQLLKLCEEGHLQLLLTVITVNEIKINFKKAARIAIEKHNELMNAKMLWPLKNLPAESKKLEKFPLLKDACNEFNILLDNELIRTKATIIDYGKVDISVVFGKYFSGEAPFNKSEKKHEFPDAFAMLLLEEWCKEKSKTSVVLSTDKDILKLRSRYLYIEPDYEKFLENTLKKVAPERLALIPMLFEKNSDYIDKFIKDWLYDQLDDLTKYYDWSNAMDVHDINIRTVDIADKTYQVTQIHDESIEVEIVVEIAVEVDIEIDDENDAFYDSEDKVMHFLGTIMRTIKKEFPIKLIALFGIESSDEYDEQCEILEINNEQDFVLEPDPWDH